VEQDLPIAEFDHPDLQLPRTAWVRLPRKPQCIGRSKKGHRVYRGFSVPEFEDARVNCFAVAVKVRIRRVAVIEEGVPVILRIGGTCRAEQKSKRKRHDRCRRFQPSAVPHRQFRRKQGILPCKPHRQIGERLSACLRRSSDQRSTLGPAFGSARISAAP
jgi:hypothetical protein